MTADKDGYEGTKRTELTPEKDSPERVILIGVVFEPDPGGEEEAERSMAELALLAESAGAVVAGRALQKRVKPDAVTYIGKGKLMEVSDAADALNAGTLVFDDELSGAQLRNIEEQTGRKVLDRTLLIMDIFAGRAPSRDTAYRDWWGSGKGFPGRGAVSEPADPGSPGLRATGVTSRDGLRFFLMRLPRFAVSASVLVRADVSRKFSPSRLWVIPMPENRP
jgi:hypothetical protein